MLYLFIILVLLASGCATQGKYAREYQDSYCSKVPVEQMSEGERHHCAGLRALMTYERQGYFRHNEEPTPVPQQPSNYGVAAEAFGRAAQGLYGQPDAFGPYGAWGPTWQQFNNQFQQPNHVTPLPPVR